MSKKKKLSKRDALYRASQLRTDKVIFTLEFSGVSLTSGVVIAAARTMMDYMISVNLGLILIVTAAVVALVYTTYAASVLIRKHEEIKELEKEYF